MVPTPWNSPCHLERFLFSFLFSQFSHSVMPDSLRSHGLQHVSLPCPSPTPQVYPNSCPLSQWCHQTISPSVVPFFSCLQSFPASGSFPISQFTSEFFCDPMGYTVHGIGQNTGVGSLSLLQGIFPVQELNWHLLHCRWILYQLTYQGSPVMSILIMKSFLMIQTHPSFSFLLITDSPAFTTVNKFIQIRT